MHPEAIVPVMLRDQNYKPCIQVNAGLSIFNIIFGHEKTIFFILLYGMLHFPASSGESSRTH